MNNYQRITAKRPEGIEKKRAFLIGSGIASLAAAEYLMRDGYMKGEQITIFEQDSLSGGARTTIPARKNTSCAACITRSSSPRGSWCG